MDKYIQRDEGVSILTQHRIEMNIIQRIDDYFGLITKSDRFWFYGTYSISLIIITFIIIVLNS